MSATDQGQNQTPTRVERTDLASLVADMQSWGPRASAIVEHRGIRRYETSYGELATRAGRFASELGRRGIVAGDRVVIWGANSADWVAAFFGCVLLGVLPVPLDAAGTTEFAERIVREVTPRLLTGDRLRLDSLQVGREQKLPFERFRAMLPPVDPALVLPRLTPDTPLQILFTSGTTGEPKGIVQTHRNLLASLLPIEREIQKYRRYERWVHPLRFLHTLPLSHVFGQFMGLWVPPLLGATVHYEGRGSAAVLARLIPRERINVLAAVPRTLSLLRTRLLAEDPTLAAEIAAAEGQPIAKRWWRFRRVHRRLGIRFWAAICGGATLPAELETFWTTLGFALVQGYGLTETAALVTLNHPFKTARGSLGKPLPGRSLRLTETGELEVSGEMVATGRWQRGRITAATPEDANDRGPGATTSAREPAWLPTGDLAALDPDGRVRFLGRTGQRLVTPAGLNIYLQDLENALEQQNEVREAAVVPLTDDAGGQEAAAILVAPAGEAAARAALDRANGSLAAHQRVSRWWLWPELNLPRTATGKIQRKTLEDWAAARAATMREETEAARDAGEGDDAAIQLLRSVTGSAPRHDGREDHARLDEAWGLDSMGRVALAAAIEEQLGLGVDDSAAAGLETVGDLRRVLRVPPVDAARSARNVAGDSQKEEQAHADGSAAAHTSRPSSSAPASTALDAPIDPQPVKPSLHRYPTWPWAFPAAAIRALFVEFILRPLAAMLASPQVRRWVSHPASEAAEDNMAQPLLLICNHRTAMDVPLLLYALPRPMRSNVAVAMSGEMLTGWRRSWHWHTLAPSLEKHRRWWGPPVAFLLTLLFNVFPLPNTVGFRESFAHAGRALDRGLNVLIFPEGRRAAEGSKLHFRPGLGILAHEAGVPVLPLALAIDEKNPQGKHGLFRLFHGRVVITTGSMAAVDTGESPEQTTMRLQESVASLLREK